MDLPSKRAKLELDDSNVPDPLDLWYDLSTFPDHILVEIFKNSDNKSKCNLALTCKKFNEIIKTVPEIYKTFKVNESQLSEFLSARIDTIPDRPIPSITFNFPQTKYWNHFLDGLITLFPTYLEKQGQFVTNICLTGLYMDYNLLIKILNLIPNAEKVYISVTRFQNPVRQEGNIWYTYREYLIEKELEKPEPVKNRFLKLKSLRFYINDLDNLDRYPIELFYEFFKDSKEITELGLSHNLNLFYNKPKLEEMYVVNNHRSYAFNSKLNMGKASESNVIFANLKKVWLEGAVFHILENLRNLEIFIMSQKQIKEVSLIDLLIYDDDDFLLVENFVNRVTDLRSLKKMKFFTIPLNIETMRSHLSIEELSTDFEIYQEIHAHFPNLKKLAVKGKITGNDEISLINQAQSLEELTIDYAYETFRGATVDFIPIQLPNLKKLVVQERSFSKKIMDEFALNSPNIVEISFGMDIVMNKDNLFVHATNMKTFKKLKRYSCSFLIDDYEFDQIENFWMFMEAGKSLEQFEVKLARSCHAEELTHKNDIDFLTSLEPHIKLLKSRNSLLIQARPCGEIKPTKIC